MALPAFVILRKSPLRDAACGGGSGRGDCLEERTALIQPIVNSFTASFARMTSKPDNPMIWRDSYGSLTLSATQAAVHGNRLFPTWKSSKLRVPDHDISHPRGGIEPVAIVTRRLTFNLLVDHYLASRRYAGRTPLTLRQDGQARADVATIEAE
jgi:hypothetical protein